MLNYNPTIEEQFNNIFCKCGHLLDPNDENGHEDGQCWASESDGIIFKACMCKNIRPILLTLEVNIFEEDLNANNNTEH